MAPRHADGAYTPSAARARGRSARQTLGGVPRLKSGCYTCRIRRKKCDEEREGDGGCKTCTRLRIQCLGFGERRPPWLRDAGTRKDVLDRIKGFLNQQGLARGGAHTPTDDDDVLQLAPSPTRTAPATHAHSRSPHSFTGSDTSSSDEAATPHLVLSAVRDEPPAYVPDYTGAPPAVSPAAELPLVDPNVALTLPGGTSDGYHPYGGVVDRYYAQPPLEPAMHSSYGPGYSSSWYDQLDDFGSPEAYVPTLALPANAQATQADPLGPLMLPPTNDMSLFFLGTDAWTQTHLKHYFTDVVKREYLLADANVFHLIWNSVLSSPAAHKSAVLLARLDHQSRLDHQPRLGQAARAEPPAARSHLLAALEQEAAEVFAGRPCMDDGDAFAALTLVSCHLFLGGRGRWTHYLDLAVDWVRGLLDRSPVDPAETLRRQGEWARFLVKTTLWFDVLGSVTRGQAPRLLAHYRRLYAGARAFDDGSAPTSMMPVMGCEGAIVLALAETSALAAWRDDEEARGRFSAVRLVAAGQRIEAELLGAPAPAPDAPPGEPAAARARRLTSAVFRASARVYLHSVLSGDMPACPEIAAAVAETAGALRRVPAGDARAVVRMVVFSICIAGCMSDEPGTRDFLVDRLASQQAEGAGNCAEVRAVMETVWRLRAAGKRVRWRDVAAQHSPEGRLLLV